MSEKWTSVLWRFSRVFVAGFIASLSVDALISGTDDMRLTILKSALAGGLVALSKYLREGKDSDSTVHKLPI